VGESHLEPVGEQSAVGKLREESWNAQEVDALIARMRSMAYSDRPREHSGVHVALDQ